MPLAIQSENHTYSKMLNSGYSNENSLMPEQMILFPHSMQSLMKQEASLYDTPKDDTNNKKRTVRASLTIEAALVFPIVLFVMASLLWCFQILYIETMVGKSMDSVSRTIAAMHPVMEEKEVSTLTAGTMVYADLMTRGCNPGYFQGGIHFQKSRLKGEMVHLVASYHLRLPFLLIPQKYICIVQKSSARKWIGNQGCIGSAEDSWVYVAETGTVYHSSRHCTHLELSIREISSLELPSQRNSSGGRYSPCLHCALKGKMPGVIYITTEGNCYHYSLSCSGLKRTVYMIKKSQVGDRRPCSKCIGGAEHP